MDVEDIVGNKSVSLSGLLKCSKSVLAAAIVKLNEISTTEAVRLKEMDLEMKRLEVESERLRIETGTSMTRELVEFGHTVKDNQYGSYAMQQVSAAVVATMSNPGSAAQPGAVEADELAPRIEQARAQGMRWNKDDKRPNRRSTVIKKLEAWEAGYAASTNADLDYWAKADFTEAVSHSESFVIGLCERMEAKLGVSVSSKYLKVRFNRDSELYAKTMIRTAVVPQNTDKSYITKTLISDWLGSDFKSKSTPQTYDWVVGRIESYCDTHGPDFKSMGIKVLKSLTSPQTIPTAIVFDRGRPHNIIQDVKRNNLYDDLYEEFWQSFCKKLGWV